MVVNNIKYMFFVISKNIKNSMAIKADFVISIIGMFINNISFLVIWFSFISTVGIVNGWTNNDIFGIYGYSCISYGIIRGFLSGLDSLPILISSGGLDRFLYTPKNKIIKVATSSFGMSAMGDLLFGIICLTIYLSNISLNINLLFLIVALIIFACIANLSFLLFSMSISFYFMDGKNISDIIYDLFILPTTFNSGLIQGVLRVIYIYAIPALLAGGLAIELVKNITLDKIILIAFVCIIWFMFSIIFFYFSLKKYESSNFMTFGQY